MTAAPDWSEGYTTDLGYVAGYYRELNPSFQAFTLATTGREANDLSARFVKIELGCGYALSLLCEAAVFPHAEFIGVDFNPVHVTWAKRLAAEAQLDNVRFYEASFADLDALGLPAADFVALHGVWSWVSQANRDVITRFLAARLNSGGVALVSYNVLPGWSANQALREVMMRKFRSTAGSTAERIRQAIAFAGEVRAAGAAIFVKHPGLSAQLDELAKMPERYLAHEYFNQDWHLFHQHEVAEALADARLSFLCSCKPAENYDKHNFLPSQLPLFEAVAAPERETLKDILLNRMFRYDLYGRGIEQAGPLATLPALLRLPFVLSEQAAKLADGNPVPPGSKIKLGREIYEPILARLRSGPATGQELMLQPGARPLPPAELIEGLAILTDLGVVLPALPPSGLAERHARARRLNGAILHRVTKGEGLSYFVSPVSGFAHSVANYFQFFVAAESQGAEAVPFAWKVLKSLGRRMNRNGVPLEDPAENLRELEKRYAEYVQALKPIWRPLALVG